MINSRTILNKSIKDCLDGCAEPPISLEFQEAMGEPIFKIVITKEESKEFVDANGRTWILKDEVKDEQI